MTAEEKHTTCDGCQMYGDNGCNLDVSICPDCYEHDQWTAKENFSGLSDFEIYLDELSDSIKLQKSSLECINILRKAMEEFAEQRIREELINYSNYYYCGFSQEEILHSTDEQLIDIYLKQRQK